MTTALAGALALSALSGIAASALFLMWPRRPTAEEWIVHRRSFYRPAPAARIPWLPRVVTGTDTPSQVRPVMGVARADLALLELAGIRVPATDDQVIRRLVWMAGGGAMVAIVLVTAVAAATHSAVLALVSPLLGLLAGAAAAAGQVAAWRMEAGRRRRDVQRNLPRLLTGARVLLESGAATAEGALAGTITTYADPAADLVREALRLKEVRHIELEAALDEVGERYGVADLQRLADSFRVGQRYGTGMSALLSDFAMGAHAGWHARYRETITRAPVLMTVPALMFFVLPLLVLVMFLVFAPLMGTLQRL